VELLRKIYEMTAIGDLIASPGSILMIIISFFLLYLGIKKQYEPLLLVPIAFGVLLANFPGGAMGVVEIEEGETLLDIAKHHGIMNFIYYSLIKTGFLPPIIFMGVGALTDFGPMLKNLRLAFFGAAAQIGIFSVLITAVSMGFTLKEAAALGIIGGADGPTAIYTTIKLAPHLLGPIAIAAYSYMALVPVIIPLIVKFTMTKSELQINMKKP
jgi:carboxybiotin decarboxylase